MMCAPCDLVSQLSSGIPLRLLTRVLIPLHSVSALQLPPERNPAALPCLVFIV